MVANIDVITEDEKYVVELYDGRYSLYTILQNKDTNMYEDSLEFCKLIKDKKIILGQKLRVAGSALINDCTDPDLEKHSMSE